MRGKSWLETATRRRIIVHTLNDQTFDGVLWEQRRDGLTLRDAALVETGRTTPLAGDVWIPRETVSFAQVPATAVIVAKPIDK